MTLLRNKTETELFHAGNVHIRSAAKFAKAKTMGGNIEIDAVDGLVAATTMGGDVNVRMVGDPAKGKRDVEIQSVGGDITLTVPFELKQEETNEWDRDNGSPRKHIYGTRRVAGGKQKIKIKTINGNIYLRKG